jgi:quinolinate synthase
MKRNTMEKLYLCMEFELPEIHLDPTVIEKGRACIDRMLEISARAGL